MPEEEIIDCLSYDNNSSDEGGFTEGVFLEERNFIKLFFDYLGISIFHKIKVKIIAKEGYLSFEKLEVVE